jgi:hypothetical protein
MNQRVRCPQCHRWTDALLVWAAGDCCPRCNAQIADFGVEPGKSHTEHTLPGPGKISGSRAGRLSRERLGERA